MGNRVPRPKHLAAKLLAIRQHLELSQVRMVMKLGRGEIAYHRLSEFEHGRRMPDLMTVLAYARAASIPMEYLADDEVDLKAFKAHLEAADKKSSNAS
jgi:transcriptional regulator with XRE-family HTH domain